MGTIFAPNENGSFRILGPRTIIVHSMGEFILDPDPTHATHFLEQLGLSAHTLVSPNGDIYITRSEDQGAYHAKGYNKDSLGIEFLVEGHHTYATFLEAIKTDWVTKAQWNSGVTIIKKWVYDYNIPRQKVVRHSEISPGRKVDPGDGFKWNKFLNEVFA